MLSDLVSLLDHNQEDALRCYSAAESAEQLGIVLIARNALMIAQASSPALMPAWVPRWADTLLSVTLRDITWTADAPLNSPEARIGNLRERLFTLEGELLERLQAVHAAEHGRSNALMELLRRSPDERLTSFIDSVQQQRRRLSNAEGYRPSRRDGASLVARLWDVVQTQHPEALGRPSRALAQALHLGRVSQLRSQSRIDARTSPPR